MLKFNGCGSFWFGVPGTLYESFQDRKQRRVRKMSDLLELLCILHRQARVCKSSCLEHKGRPPIAYLQQFAMWHLFLLEQDANQLMSIYFGITAAVLHLAAHQSTGFTPSPDCHRTPLRFRRRHHRTRCNAAALLDPSSLLDPIV